MINDEATYKYFETYVWHNISEELFGIAIQKGGEP